MELKLLVALKQVIFFVVSAYAPAVLATAEPRTPPCDRPLPVDMAVLTSQMGNRLDPFGDGKATKFHYGVDLGAPEGTPVRSIDDGRVAFAGRSVDGSVNVILRHSDGTSSKYAHLSRIHVALNQVVPAGFIIGAVGSTGPSLGPHLHLETYRRRGWKPGDHFDPLPRICPYARRLWPGERP